MRAIASDDDISPPITSCLRTAAWLRRSYRPGAPPPAISNQTYSQSAHNESRRQEPFGGKPLSLDCRNPTQIDQMLRGSVESLVMLWWMSTQPKTRSYIDPEHKTCPHKNNRVVMQA
ncbi:hypothetical protein RB195_023689 [Necator americanus]|uniref:Uncharacterized protein n=1 Tax=Necator americanus TaxID=51031 RepID=A0ABR1EKF0_NECAM